MNIQKIAIGGAFLLALATSASAQERNATGNIICQGGQVVDTGTQGCVDPFGSNTGFGGSTSQGIATSGRVNSLNQQDYADSVCNQSSANRTREENRFCASVQ